MKKQILSLRVIHLRPAGFILAALIMILCGCRGLKSVCAAGEEEDRVAAYGVQQALESLDLEGKDACGRALEVYDYVCMNFRCDEDFIPETGKEETDFLSSLFLEGESSSKGLTFLTMRLLKGAGIDSAACSGERHTWVLARIGQLYYHLDPARDIGNTGKGYLYFLKGEEGYQGGPARDAICSSASFRARYPVSQKDYPVPTPTPLPVKTPSSTPTPTPTPVHEHRWDTRCTVDLEPSCTKKGRKSIYCIECGKKKEGSMVSIPALGHDWTDFKTEKEADVFSSGMRIRSCRRCGKQEKKIIPKEKKILVLSVSELEMVKNGVSGDVFIKEMGKGDSLAECRYNHTYLDVSVSDAKAGKLKIKALKKGKASLTVKLASGRTKSVKVSILPLPTKKIALPVTALTLYADKKSSRHIWQLQPAVYPMASDEKLVYSSSDTGIVKVTQKGKLTAVKKGRASITIRSGTVQRTLHVTVK